MSDCPIPPFPCTWHDETLMYFRKKKALEKPLKEPSTDNHTYRIYNELTGRWTAVTSGTNLCRVDGKLSKSK